MGSSTCPPPGPSACWPCRLRMRPTQMGAARRAPGSSLLSGVPRPSGAHCPPALLSQMLEVQSLFATFWEHTAEDRAAEGTEALKGTQGPGCKAGIRGHPGRLVNGWKACGGLREAWGRVLPPPSSRRRPQEGRGWGDGDGPDLPFSNPGADLGQPPRSPGPGPGRFPGCLQWPSLQARGRCWDSRSHRGGGRSSSVCGAELPGGPRCFPMGREALSSVVVTGNCHPCAGTR